MVVIMRPDASVKEKLDVENAMKGFGMEFEKVPGVLEGAQMVYCIMGDEYNVEEIAGMPGVQKVAPAAYPFKILGRNPARDEREKFPFTKVLEFKGKGKNAMLGGDELVVIAGLCAVDDYQQFVDTSLACVDAGADIIRVGVEKPRTSPYAFQGRKENGFEMVQRLKYEHNIQVPIIAEVMNVWQYEDLVKQSLDGIWTGARSMQFTPFMESVAKLKMPTLVKRSATADISEWILAGEYMAKNGNSQIGLIERGVKRLGNDARNTFDVNAIPLARRYTWVPVVGDPSHGTGKEELVEPIAYSAVAAGAHGLMIEVFLKDSYKPTPRSGDYAQSVVPKTLDRIIRNSRPLYKTIQQAYKEGA